MPRPSPAQLTRRTVWIAAAALLLCVLALLLWPSPRTTTLASISAAATLALTLKFVFNIRIGDQSTGKQSLRTGNINTNGGDVSITQVMLTTDNLGEQATAEVIESLLRHKSKAFINEVFERLKQRSGDRFAENVAGHVVQEISRNRMLTGADGSQRTLTEGELAVVERALKAHDLETRMNAASLNGDDALAQKLRKELQDKSTTEECRRQTGYGYVDYLAGRFDDAIPYYERAHQLRPDDPYAMNNLAIALQQARLGDLSKQTHLAIELNERALRTWTKDAHPAEWATTQNNLGTAWRSLPTGDRGENIRNAITHFENALSVYTKDAHPAEWATAQNNLGNAWQNLPTGDRVENIRNAIKHYDNALSVRTKDAHPADWATTQNNLGTAWAELAEQPDEDRCDLLRRAIAASRGALTVRTAEAMPHDHEMTKRNMEIDIQAFLEAGCGTQADVDAIPPAE